MIWEWEKLAVSTGIPALCKLGNEKEEKHFSLKSQKNLAMLIPVF